MMLLPVDSETEAILQLLAVKAEVLFTSLAG